MQPHVYAIIDIQPNTPVDDQAWLVLSKPGESWHDWIDLRNRHWKHCPILDTTTGEIVSPAFLREESPYDSLE